MGPPSEIGEAVYAFNAPNGRPATGPRKCIARAPAVYTIAVMADRPAYSEDEIQSRRRVVELARDVLAGRLSYLEGAVQIYPLCQRLGGVADSDPDVTAFCLIYSETDHLPLKGQRHLWSQAALDRLASEIAGVEAWAEGLAAQACRNIISRFSTHDS